MQERRRVRPVIQNAWSWREDPPDNVVPGSYAKPTRTRTLEAFAHCGRSASRTGRWATPRSGTSTSARARRLSGPPRASTRPSATAASVQNTSAARGRSRRSIDSGGALHLLGPALRRRRARPPGRTWTALLRLARRGGRAEGLRARDHRRARHAAAARPPATSGSCRRRCRRRRDRDACPAATTRWTATSAGSASRRPTRRS